jgi:hypothetical protein
MNMKNTSNEIIYYVYYVRNNCNFKLIGLDKTDNNSINYSCNYACIVFFFF